ncbi:MAG: type II secretion system protein [bacterium]
MKIIRHAFSLIEIMIVVGIIAILLVGTLLTVRVQRSKAEDTTMKTDLSRLKIAFEDYYNDHNCYPPADWFNGPEDVNSTVLQPYLKQMLYNRKTLLPYVLEKDPTGCSWFKIYTTLNNADDPQAVTLRSPFGSTLGNYGVSSTNTTVSIYYDSLSSSAPSPTTSPSPTPNPDNIYYCSGIHNCSSFDNTRFDCTPNYADTECTGSNNCASLGSCRSLKPL